MAKSPALKFLVALQGFVHLAAESEAVTGAALLLFFSVKYFIINLPDIDCFYLFIYLFNLFIIYFFGDIDQFTLKNRNLNQIKIFHWN